MVEKSDRIWLGVGVFARSSTTRMPLGRFSGNSQAPICGGWRFPSIPHEIWPSARGSGQRCSL